MVSERPNPARLRRCLFDLREHRLKVVYLLGRLRPRLPCDGRMARDRREVGLVAVLDDDFRLALPRELHERPMRRRHDAWPIVRIAADQNLTVENAECDRCLVAVELLNVTATSGSREHYALALLNAT